jgi:hypothetical protein
LIDPTSTTSTPKPTLRNGLSFRQGDRVDPFGCWRGLLSGPRIRRGARARSERRRRDGTTSEFNAIELLLLLPLLLLLMLMLMMTTRAVVSDCC